MTAIADPATPMPRWASRLAWLILAVGVVLRLRYFLEGHSFWSDEVRLALNIATRSFGELLGRLEWDQTAPIPFLWASRLSVTLGGVGERACRLVPFLAGILLLPLSWRLARRLLPVPGALLGLALIALSPQLVFYSAEFKPYAMDALIAVVLSLLLLEALDHPEARAPYWRLVAAGVLAVLCSSAAPFLLGGVGLALLLAPQIRRQPGSYLRLAIGGALWGGCFVLLYLLIYRHAAGSEFMQRSWTPHFLTPGSDHLGFRSWYIGKEILARFLFKPHVGPGQMDETAAATVWLLIVLGIVAVGRRSGAWSAALLAGPAAAVLAASAVRQYPIWPRLVMFEAPFLMLVLAAGMTQVIAWLPRRLAPAGWAVVSLAILAPAIRVGAQSLTTVPLHSDGRQLVRVQQAKRRPGEAIYVAAVAIPSWAFYSTDWHAPDLDRLHWLASMAQSTGPAFSNRPSREGRVEHEGWELVRPYLDGEELLGIGTGKEFHFIPPFPRQDPDENWAENEAARIEAAAGNRIWLYFSEAGPGDTRQLLQAVEARGGRRMREWSATGASLFLYNFESGAGLTDPPAPAVP